MNKGYFNNNDKRGWTEILRNSVQLIFLNLGFVVPKIILVLSAVILWGCSHETDKISEHFQKLTNLTVIPADIRPENIIRIKRDTSYGSTNDVLIDIAGSIVVDDSGRVYVTGGGPNGINIFDSDGRYLSSIGRKGRGPGEFMTAPGLHILSNRLYAIDYMAYRISVFSVDSLKLIHTVNINLRNKIKTLADYAIHQLIPKKGGKFLICFTDILPELPDLSAGIKIDTLYRRYYSINKEGRLIPKQVLKIKDKPIVTESFFQGVVPISFHFYNKPLVAVSNDGSIYTANSKDFLIKEYSPDGQYLRAFFHPYQKVSLTRETALESYTTKSNPMVPSISESMLQYIINARQRMIRQIDLPPNWPALNDLLVDGENRFWLSTIVNDQTVYQWWVLDKSGKLLACFKWPRSKPIKILKNGYMYTVETNKKTGLERVVRYKITME